VDRKGPFRSFFFLALFLFSLLFLGWNNNHRLGQKMCVLCVCVWQMDEREKKKEEKKKKKSELDRTGQPNKLISALLEIFPSQRGFMVVCV